jgi:hypothetical protein
VVLVQAPRHIVDAMAGHEVHELVCVPSCGLGDSKARMGWLVRNVIVRSS